MHEKMNQPPTRPNTSTAVILATLADCAPPFPGLVTPTVAFRDTPAGSPLTRHRLHSVGLTWHPRLSRAPRREGNDAWVGQSDRRVQNNHARSSTNSSSP